MVKRALNRSWWSCVPNVLTGVRMALIVPFAWCFAHRYYGMATLLFCAAGVTDGLDGYLARRFGWLTRWGAVMDPLADKALVLVAFGMLYHAGAIPGALCALIYWREGVLLSGALWYQLTVGPFPVRPRWLSKCNTLCQIAFLFCHLSNFSVWIVPAWWMQCLTVAVWCTACASWVDYMVLWVRLVRHTTQR